MRPMHALLVASVIVLAGALAWVYADAPRPAQALLLALGFVWVCVLLDTVPWLKR